MISSFLPRSSLLLTPFSFRSLREGSEKTILLSHFLAEVVKIVPLLPRFASNLPEQLIMVTRGLSENEWLRIVSSIKKLFDLSKEIASESSEDGEILQEQLQFLSDSMLYINREDPRDLYDLQQEIELLLENLTPFLEEAYEEPSLLYALVKAEVKMRLFLKKTPLQLLFPNGVKSVRSEITSEWERLGFAHLLPELDLLLHELSHGTN